MTPEQIYFLTLGLLNLVVALAGSRIKDLDDKPASIHFLTFGFLAFSISWFLYAFEIGMFFKIISAILSLIFIWGIVLFSFNRCEKKVPWFFIITGFIVHSLIQGYLTYNNNFTAVLHLSAVIIPSLFLIIIYLFSKVKKEINSSDITLIYVFLIMSVVLISRSIALEISADFFAITKITSQAIWPAFSVAVGVFSFLSFTEEAQGKLKIESITDPLTGILNRRGFIDALKEKTEEAWISNHQVTLVMFDLDHFKNVNDTYGHDSGDLVLKKCAQQIKLKLRDGDLFGRYGGEEFVILLFGVDIIKAQSIAERMRVGIEEMNCSSTKDEIKITASFGLTEIIESDEFEKAFIKADNAMYDAKNNGRNRTEVSKEVK
ncbi:diguanylate cyclase [Arcobacteraceae bacterium]|nr:diguanylate cyclase [Arcobacteraceae bacterium]